MKRKKQQKLEKQQYETIRKSNQKKRGGGSILKSTDSRGKNRAVKNQSRNLPHTEAPDNMHCVIIANIQSSTILIVVEASILPILPYLLPSKSSTQSRFEEQDKKVW